MRRGTECVSGTTTFSSPRPDDARHPPPHFAGIRRHAKMRPAPRMVTPNTPQELDYEPAQRRPPWSRMAVLSGASVLAMVLLIAAASISGAEHFALVAFLAGFVAFVAGVGGIGDAMRHGKRGVVLAVLGLTAGLLSLLFLMALIVAVQGI